MHVSKNGGDSWDPVQVPTVTPERVLFVVTRVVPNSWQPAELTGYLGHLCQLLLWFIYFFKDKLFVPLVAQLHENETYFSLQFIDLKIIWLAQR